MCRPESLPVRARLGTRQKCGGNVRPLNTFKRHSSCRPLHFKHGKGPSHPQKALRACLRWMNERPIAFSQASCPYFPICTRFLMPGQPFSALNRQNFHRRGAFRAFLCATPGGRRFDAHAGALLYIYAEALILGYSIRGTPRVIRNEKRQIELPRASADSTPILTDQKPSSGSFWANHGRARVPARRKYIKREHVSARITSRASSSRYEAKMPWKCTALAHFQEARKLPPASF